MQMLLPKIKLRLSIYSRIKSSNSLTGEYASAFKGRSMDLDDLHEYVIGDNVKDIDWRASVRSNKVLVKRYVAERKNNVLMIVNTGRNMYAVNADGSENKRDIAINVCGVMGCVVTAHGDLVSMVSGNNTDNIYRPLRGTDNHLEISLRDIYHTTQANADEGDLLSQLQYAAKINRKMTVLIVTDEHQVTSDHIHWIKKLASRCEIMWVTICDYDFAHAAAAAGQPIHDATLRVQLPEQILRQPRLLAAFHERQQVDRDARVHVLAKLGIAHQYVQRSGDVIRDLALLLERHRYARR